LMTFIGFFSDSIVHVFFNSSWSLTSGILKWLAPTAIIQSVLSTTGSVFSAKGRTDLLMRLGFLGALLQFGSFLIGVNFNIYTFSMCYFIANVVNFFPVMMSLYCIIEGKISGFFYKIYPIIISISLVSILLIPYGNKITLYANAGLCNLIICFISFSFSFYFILFSFNKIKLSFNSMED